MNRIQQILEKAEREGVVRRVHGSTKATEDVFRVDTFIPTPLAAPPPPPSTPTGAIGATTVAAIVPRIVAGARLDTRLLPSISVDGAAAEQYRALRTRIFHVNNGVPVHAVLVTSPGRGEGKTLTVANLGLTMAQEYQQRVCVVEADLRHPQMQRLFGLPDGPGLVDVLTGQAALEDALTTLDEHQITILPAGRPPERPAELLGTMAMRRVMEALRSQFDRILIDSAAASPLADVGILTPLADTVLLVVRAGLTSRPAIHDAVAAIDPAKLLGIVLNGTMAH